MDGIAVRGLESLFRGTDHNKISVDSPLVVAYEEETRSFPCRICGALYYSGAQLERHIATYHANERRYCCKQNFKKIITNC